MNDLTLQILGVTGNALMVLGYVPQIRKIVITRKAEDISILTWLGYLTGDLCLLAYALLTNDGVFVSLFTLFTVGNVTLVVLTIKYGKIHLRLPKRPKEMKSDLKNPDTAPEQQDPATNTESDTKDKEHAAKTHDQSSRHQKHPDKPTSPKQ